MILTKKTSVVILELSLSHCAGVATVNRPNPAIQKTCVKDQNYTIGKRPTAYIGESMARVKDFLVSQSKTTYMRPDQAFTLSKWADQIHGAQGGHFKISGQTKIEGKHFTALDARNVAGAHYRLLVDEGGYLDSRVVTASPWNGVFVYNLSPPRKQYETVHTSGGEL